MNGRQVVVAVVLAALVVLAGCSAADMGDSGDGALNGDSGGDGGSGGGDGDGARQSGGGDGGDSGDSAAQGTQPTGSANADIAAQQALIRTGNARIEVEDHDAARANLTAAVHDRGGFVSDTSQEVHRRGNQTWTTGTVVFRVPAENFSAFFERVKAEGEVQHSETQTEDVTDQLLDIEARLSNLRNERDRLRTLYEQANTTEDVLAVRAELSDVQEEIERLEAKKRSLENRVAYSTVRVSIGEERPDPGPRTERSQWYETPLTKAFLSSVDGVVLTARAGLVALAYAAPYLLAFGIPVVALGFVIRRRR